MKQSQYKIETSFFEDINNEKKAYFLGLFCADGCNFITRTHTRCFISLQEDDKYILEVLNAEIFPNKDRKLIYRKAYGNSKPQYKFEVFNKKISNDLLSHGVTPRKSLTIEFPHNIPNHLISHFIRGYFDGDGSIGGYCYKGRKTPKYRISILSSEMFLKTLSSFLPSNIRFSIKKNGKIYKLHISGNNQVKLFCDFIYNNANLFLTRKYAIYQNLLMDLLRLKKKTSSRYNGVSYSKTMKKWMAYFYKRDKPIIKVGWFKSEEEAFKHRNNYILPFGYEDLEKTKNLLSYQKI